MATLATINLYHWAEPGVFWHRRPRPGDPRPHAHDAESWAAKRAWLVALLAEMDADIVAFQEVVSTAALAETLGAAGYAHVAFGAEPHFLADDPAVYTRPVQALASRAPMRAVPLDAPPGVARTLGLSHDRAFRRPPVRAVVETTDLGPVLAYSCHLKSAGVSVGDALMAGAHEEPEETDAAARWRLEALSRAHGASAIQRVFEASAIYHDAAAAIAEAPSRPVVVLGDLNDEPDSPSLRALTAYRPFERDGCAEAAEDRADPADRYRLIDAYRLAPKAVESDRRPATHRHGADGAVIDFALVSAACRAGAADQIACVRDHRVHDGHFLRADPVRTSDHAGVSVRIEPV